MDMNTELDLYEIREDLDSIKSLVGMIYLVLVLFITAPVWAPLLTKLVAVVKEA